ncbi:MAG TPA: DUF4926 domain-containing protein [Herpetosiphonaceae bacterium]
MMDERSSVVLTEDLPDYDLVAGDVGTVVLVHGGGAGYEVEFVALNGQTLAVVSLRADQVRPIGAREIAHAWSVAAAPHA